MYYKVFKDPVVTLTVTSVLWALTVILFASPVSAQVVAKEEPTAVAIAVKSSVAPSVPTPLIDDVKGVTIGMTADEVENKLGHPEAKDASSMYFDFDGKQSIQLAFDADKKVSVIATTYTGDGASPPKAADVFGQDVKIEPAANGSIYKMVRYPSAGVWVAYSRMATSDNALTTVTIKKIAK